MLMKSEKLQCTFCLLGPPASGKGTIGSLLSERFGCQIITPGDIYRRLREEDSELGNLVRESLKDGGYCPDSLTNKIMLEEANKVDAGMILDGYPRTMVQFDALMEHFDVHSFLCFDAPYENLKHCATNRVQCSSCNKVWSKLYNESDCCGCTNRTWKERFDDSEDMYPKRFEVYLDLTAPIINAVEGLSNYHKFQSLGNPNIVAEVMEWIKNRD